MAASTVKLGDESGQLSSLGFPKDAGAQQDPVDEAPHKVTQAEASKTGTAGPATTSAAAKKPGASRTKLVLGGRKPASAKAGKKLGLVKNTEQVDNSVFSQVLLVLVLTMLLVNLVWHNVHACKAVYT